MYKGQMSQKGEEMGRGEEVKATHSKPDKKEEADKERKTGP